MTTTTQYIYLEQRGASGDTQHSKFFRIEDDGHKVTASWGPTGSQPNKHRVKVLVESDDPAVRKSAWDKKLKEKAGRKTNPYVIIESNGSKVESRPSSEGRRWGLEVETHSRLSPEDIAKKMVDRGLKVNLAAGRYFHSDGSAWDLKRDGSCGYELASPILSGEAGVFDAKLAVEKIREVCPTAVNSKCGIHVTVDVSDHSPEELKQLILAYLRAQECFYSRCNESRQDNQYAMRNSSSPATLAHINSTNNLELIIARASGGTRYRGLNLMRTRSKKIVEFRMLESSVAIRKVGAWIMTCVGFIDGVKAGKAPAGLEPISEEQFLEII